MSLATVTALVQARQNLTFPPKNLPNGDNVNATYALLNALNQRCYTNQ
jgi:hypothetical protein